MKKTIWHRLKLVGILFLLICGLFAVNLIACSCTPETYAPSCQRLSTAPVVFLGEPVEFTNGVYRFRIEKVYKGLEPNTSETAVYGLAGTSCEIEYTIGEKYIIFAENSSQQNKPLITSMCSGSRIASEADINFLNNYVIGKSETVVFGQVLQWVTGIGLPGEDEKTPIKGASVVLENEREKYKTVSDADGWFNLTGIQAGDYKLSARLAPFMSDPPFYKVSVIKGGCGLVFVQLKSMSGIEGTLLYADGSPAANQRIELLRKSRKGKWYSTYYMWKQTDDRGKFKFDEIESGDYLIGYEIWGDYPSNDSPYPTHYYPGVSGRTDAQTLTLVPGQSITGIKLRLPEKQTKRKITIKIVFPDGKPPGKNLLQISNYQRLLRNLSGDGDWTYTFTGYQEREYEFSARYWVDDLMSEGDRWNKRITKSEVLKLKPGKEDIEVTLVLNKTILRKDEID